MLIQPFACTQLRNSWDSYNCLLQHGLNLLSRRAPSVQGSDSLDVIVCRLLEGLAAVQEVLLDSPRGIVWKTQFRAQSLEMSS